MKPRDYTTSTTTTNRQERIAGTKFDEQKKTRQEKNEIDGDQTTS